MTYQSDRSFTNYIHQNLALPKIYEVLDWQKVELKKDILKEIDIEKGIDYVFEKEGKYKTVQERFREKKYSKFSDFTIRYRREGNKHLSRKQSEFYKIKADFFVYGIVNGDKSNFNSCQDFLKFAVINLDFIYQKIHSKEILIQDNQEHFCKVIDNQMICPIKYNKDKSSSFFPIDIQLLAKLWKNQGILLQKGFIESF